MNDARFMGRFEGLGDLLGDGQGFVDRDRASLDAICQGRPFNQFEDKRTDVIRFFESVDGRDVWMVE